MICPNCSQFVADGSRFCTNCGSRLIDDVAPQQPQPEQPVQPQMTESQPEAEAVNPGEAASEQTPGATQNYTQEAPTYDVPPVDQNPTYNYYSEPVSRAVPVGETVTKAGMSKPVLFGIIGGGVFLVAAAITLLIVFLVAGSTTQYNLQNYTIVEFEGTEGSGVAAIKLDEEKLATDIAKNNGMDIEEMKDMDLAFDAFSKLFKDGTVSDAVKLISVISSIDIGVDKPTGLSNGDTVTIRYQFNEELGKDIDVEFIGEPMQATVSGLTEVQEIDPFDDLEITFEGTSPNAYITLNNKQTLGEVMNFVWFEVERFDGYKLGDTVTVKLMGYDEQAFTESYGVKFSQTEKDYTVEGVDAIICDTEELEQGAVDIMRAATEEYINQYFSDSSRSKYISATDIQYEGYYILANKSPDVWYGHNQVFMIFSAKVSSLEKKKQFKPSTVYMPVQYIDVKRKADGTYEVDTDYKNILGSTDLKFGFWETVSGYNDIAGTAELVEAESANYDAKYYGSKIDEIPEAYR